VDSMSDDCDGIQCQAMTCCRASAVVPVESHLIWRLSSLGRNMGKALDVGHRRPTALHCTQADERHRRFMDEGQ